MWNWCVNSGLYHVYYFPNINLIIPKSRQKFHEKCLMRHTITLCAMYVANPPNRMHTFPPSIHPYSLLGTVRVPFDAVSSTATSNTGSPCVSVFWVNASQATLFTSLFKHSDNVFLCFHRLLLTGIAKSVTGLIQDVVRCTCKPSNPPTAKNCPNNLNVKFPE